MHGPESLVVDKADTRVTKGPLRANKREIVGTRQKSLSFAYLLISLGSFIALTACQSAPQDLLRWNKLTGDVPDSQPPHLWVTTQSGDASPTLKPNGLPDHAAAEYIRIIAKGFDPKQPDKLRAYLAKPIEKPTATVNDQTEMSRVMTVILDRSVIRPGDRYLMTRIEIMPGSSIDYRKSMSESINWSHDFEFVDYQQATSSISSINIGNVTFSHEVATSFVLTPTVGGAATASANLGPTVTNIQAGTRNINDRASMGVSVIPTRVVINQTGAEGTDLTGSVLIKLGLKFDEHVLERVYFVEPNLVDQDTGVIKEPKDADLAISPVDRPKNGNYYLCGRVTYYERIIEDGREHWDEGKQTVRIERQTIGWDAFPALANSESSPPAWDISIAGRENRVLKLKIGAKIFPAIFSDKDEAIQFIDWLKKTSPPFIGKKKIVVGGGSANVNDSFEPIGDFNGLSVRLRQTERQAHEITARERCKMYDADGTISTAG